MLHRSGTRPVRASPVPLTGRPRRYAPKVVQHRHHGNVLDVPFRSHLPGDLSRCPLRGLTPGMEQLGGSRRAPGWRDRGGLAPGRHGRRPAPPLKPPGRRTPHIRAASRLRPRGRSEPALELAAIHPPARRRAERFRHSARLMGRDRRRSCVNTATMDRPTAELWISKFNSEFRARLRRSRLLDPMSVPARSTTTVFAWIMGPGQRQTRTPASSSDPRTCSDARATTRWFPSSGRSTSTETPRRAASPSASRSLRVGSK